MGYITLYLLEIYTTTEKEPLEKNHLITQIIKDLETISGYEDMMDEPPFIGQFKWYDWEKDMVKLSKKYDQFMFELQGVGEENYPDEIDIWKARFFQGTKEHSRATLSFPEFKNILDVNFHPLKKEVIILD